MRPRELAAGAVRWLTVSLHTRRFVERNLEPGEIRGSLDGDRLIARRWYADAERLIGVRLARALETIGFLVGSTPSRMVFAYR